MPRTCPSQDALSEFLHGDLHETELVELAAHPEWCPQCDRIAGRLDARVDAVLNERRRILKRLLTPRTASGAGGPSSRPKAPPQS